MLTRIGPVAYKLELPEGAQIHDVFHVSLLKKKWGPIESAIVTLPPVSDDATILPEPEFVLDRRVVQNGKYRPKTEVLIQWKGASREDATWENLWRFSRSYPAFGLKDKNRLKGKD